MLVAIFADIHGNLPALELFLSEIPDVDKYICLGDVVNYGPWSNECVLLVDQLKDKVTLKGNHDEYFIQGKYGGASEVARAFFDVCFPSFLQSRIISDYVDSYRQGGYHFVHTLDNRIIFADTDVQLREPTVLAHSHKQYITEKSGFKLINPGSVGQNRTYINVINYIIWDTAKDIFTEKKILYNPDVVINEMRVRKFPKICIEYYSNKKRF